MHALSAMASATQSALDDSRWARVVARDESADGRFWYSVSSTRVYCRPSCPSRTANPENVQFYDSLEEVQATGYRACKRCKPDGERGSTRSRYGAVLPATRSDSRLPRRHLARPWSL